MSGRIRIRTVSDRGFAELMAHEALVTSPYRDSVGVWTIGVGHTAMAGPPNPQTMPREPRPVAEMVALFRRDLAKYEADVAAAVTVPLHQHEFDALVSWHFNTGAVRRASLVKALNRGDYAAAARGLLQWSKPPEIMGRRRAEHALFTRGAYVGDGKVTVYPATAGGQVMWKRGKRVDVADLMRDDPSSRPAPQPAPQQATPPAPAPPPPVTAAPPPQPEPAAPVAPRSNANAEGWLARFLRGLRRG